MKINLYDFDKTIFDGDSSVKFYFYCLKKYPRMLRRLPSVIGAYINHYILKKTNKTVMKEIFFRFVEDIDDIDKEVKDFWKKNSSRIKKFYNEKDHSNDIIISASPEFLLEPICKELKVKKLMASRVDKKTGKFEGLNCHGEEKVTRLNKVYKKYEVEESYSDSLSDTPILKLAKKAYLVKKNNLKEIKF